MAAEKGGSEVALPVLAATLTTVVVFFPVTFLYGVSRFLFTALALAVVLSLFASYFVALTVVPLFCAKFIKGASRQHDAQRARGTARPWASGSTRWFNRRFQQMLDRYERRAELVAAPAAGDGAGHHGRVRVQPGALSAHRRCLLSRAPTPASSSSTSKRPPARASRSPSNWSQQVEDIVREEVVPGGPGHRSSPTSASRPGFSSIYTSNSGQHTAFVQVSLKEGHHVSSYEYMDRVRQRIAAELPQLSAYFQTGGLVDAVLNLGLPAPIDIQVSGIEPARRPTRPRRRSRTRSARCRASATCWCRRTSIIPACNSTSTASAPANWA